MAIKGLSELLKRHKGGEIDDVAFEGELHKALAEDWIPKSKFNELNDAKKVAEDNYKSATKALDDLKEKAGLSDEYKAQIDSLKAEAQKAEEAHKKAIETMRRDTAISNALTSAKAKNTKAVRALLDEAKLVLQDDGSLLGLTEQIEAVKKDNGFLFEADTKEGARPYFGASDKGAQGVSSADSIRAAMFAAAGLKDPSLGK